MSRYQSDYLDLRLADCMDMMREFPDKHFDLAIVDPPYGIGVAKRPWGSSNKGAVTDYGKKAWDSATPTPEYFTEARRVSQKQIIWGGNYFPLPPSPCWIVWDKDNSGDFADCELAWTSFPTAVRKFRFRWNGMLQENMAQKEKRIHPTQKPVALYSWLLTKYAKPGQRILDTHLGSGSIAIACHNIGCHLVASEIDPDYFRAACERVENATLQPMLFRS
jgi:site-specific DNA-methyltransferase (adenine-specific)